MRCGIVLARQKEMARFEAKKTDDDKQTREEQHSTFVTYYTLFQELEDRRASHEESMVHLRSRKEEKRRGKGEKKATTRDRVGERLKLGVLGSEIEYRNVPSLSAMA